MRHAPSIALLPAMLIALGAGCAPRGSYTVDSGPVDAAADGAGPVDPTAWPNCPVGQSRCVLELYQRCLQSGEFGSAETTDCAAQGQVCSPTLGCVACKPGQDSCDADQLTVLHCRADGSGADPVQTCDSQHGEGCRGGHCVPLCDDIDIANTNIGCEYYAADLDNAVVDAFGSAAAQQYAIVVSNPDPLRSTRVQIEWNTAPQGQPPRTSVVASAILPPLDLEVFKLPAREVDCSAPGTFDTGTGTCLSSQAYRISSSVPVIAYQFNPLENVNVFSNDASLLLPTNSISGDYVVTGWPQTIAVTNDPNTNFGQDLRAFLTIVGTADQTHVTVMPTADVVPGGPLVAGARAGVPFDVTLGRFDVLNLETGGFLADFTGTRISADQPVAVFSGSEASDAPAWTTMSDRQCCADHLEEQLAPARTVGVYYVAARMPSRAAAVRAAGAEVTVANSPQFFRVVNADERSAHVTTTLPSNPSDPESAPVQFDLAPGEHRTLRAMADFTLHADRPVALGTVTGSQDTTGIPSSLPGGDPSFIMVPPRAQWRQRYVFLTPDKYAFDFVTIVGRPGHAVRLDGTPLPYNDCTMDRADACVDQVGQPACPPPDYVTYRCQLSFPQIDTSSRPFQILPGRQADGVHVVESDDTDEGVMVIVSGFDRYVGYGYPAGTGTRTLPR